MQVDRVMIVSVTPDGGTELVGLKSVTKFTAGICDGRTWIGLKDGPVFAPSGGKLIFFHQPVMLYDPVVH